MAAPRPNDMFWICLRCSFTNGAHNRFCLICGESQPSQRTQNPPFAHSSPMLNSGLPVAKPLDNSDALLQLLTDLTAYLRQNRASNAHLRRNAATAAVPMLQPESKDNTQQQQPVPTSQSDSTRSIKSSSASNSDTKHSVAEDTTVNIELDIELERTASDADAKARDTESLGSTEDESNSEATSESVSDDNDTKEMAIAQNEEAEEPHKSDLSVFRATTKVKLCPKGLQCEKGINCFNYHGVHDRRRDPELYSYKAQPCPHIYDWHNSKMFLHTRQCPDGDHCQFSHNFMELGYHCEAYKVDPCPYLKVSPECPFVRSVEWFADHFGAECVRKVEGNVVTIVQHGVELQCSLDMCGFWHSAQERRFIVDAKPRGSAEEAAMCAKK